jgi:multiple sugar transport system substrate-binding protein
MRKRLMLMAGISAFATGTATAQQVTLDYWLWDAPQKPAYEVCAAAFTAKNPNIAIKISQFGWGDYWTGVTTGFVSGTAPDVFVNNVSRFPEFLDNGQLTDLTPLIERDGVPVDIFRPGLVDLWSAEDGHLYGMPKDWDTIALVYNADLLAEKGIDPSSLNDLTWNPTDGGSFGQLIRTLAVDSKGNDGASPAYDKASVERYGLVNSKYEGIGQVGWSHLATEIGFKHLEAPWGGDYHYDSPALAETLTWLRQLTIDKVAIPLAEMGELGGAALFHAGKGALLFDGSWRVNFHTQNAPFKVGFAPIPKGPDGTRKSNLNGVADAIWTGTDNPAEAWEWVKFLGSRECQDLIGQQAVVFPAIPESTAIAQETHQAKGVDVSAYVDIATPDQTFLNPVTYHGSEVLSIVNAAFDKIFLGTDDVAPILKQANDEVRALF